MIKAYANKIVEYLSSEKFNVDKSTYPIGTVIKAEKKKLFSAKILVLIVSVNEASQIQEVVDYIQTNNSSDYLNLVVCLTSLEFTKEKCVYMSDNASNIIHFVYINNENNSTTYNTDVHYSGTKHINQLIKIII